MDVSIVIPIHNESGNIEQLAEELDAVLNPPTPVGVAVADQNHMAFSLLENQPEAPLSEMSDFSAPQRWPRPQVEVIFVNDTSTDGSGEILNQLAEKYDFIRVIHLETRGGQTGCYQVAFQQAIGEYIIRMDGDLQDVPADLHQFFELLPQNPDVIIGLRTLRRHRRILRIATLLYDTMMIALFDTPFHTNSSSFIAYRAKFVQNIPFKRNDHRYLPLIAIHRGANNLYEVLVRNRDRKFGRTKYGYYSKFLKGIPEVLRFLYRLKKGYYSLSKHPLMGE